MLKTKDDIYYKGAREDVACLVPNKARRVLDIGCAYGITGALIKDRGVQEVIGVEINEQAYKEAVKRLDKVFLGDIQDIVLPYDKGYFDCIIYADVLEHLIDPWSVLARYKDLLNDEGVVIASIPNIRHYRVIKKLLKGRWDYQEMGVMDSTHLRFFTLKNIEEMFQNAGYSIEEIVYKISASKIKKLINRLLRGALNRELSEQFIVKAAKEGNK